MDLGTLAAGLATIAIYSFLYKDNPAYRLAEHLLIGLSVGFTLVLVYNTVLVPKLITPLFSDGHLERVIPALFGLSMFARFRRGWSSLSKPALALMIGAGAGLSIPAMLEARVLRQLAASVEPFAQVAAGEITSWWAIVTMLISLTGVVSVMVYFFFTRPDRRWLNGVSRLGVYFLMLFFGATFGYTVPSRLSLLIGRLEFLLGDFLRLL